MPIQNGSYVSPTWQDYGPPSMDAAEMQAISDTTEQTQNDKANIDSPAFTGTPAAPTPASGDNSNKIATTAFVRANLSNAFAGRTASGSIATFSDGADNISVKALTVDIEPSQDLHGQTNPFPAGSTKNKWMPYTGAAVNGISAAYNPATGEITLNGTASAVTTLTVALPYTLVAGDYALSANNPVASSSVTLRLGNSGTIVRDVTINAVNRTSTFTTTSDTNEVTIRIASGTALTNFVIKPQLESGASVTAYELCQNLCPITGWTGAEITRIGKNLIDQTDTTKGVIDQPTGVPMPNPSGTASYTGEYRIVGGGNVTVTASANVRLFWYGIDGYIGNSLVTVSGGVGTVSVPANATIFRLQATTTVFDSPIQVEYGTAATDYVPYTATTYTVDWTDEAGTVYKGTLDPITGVLTVTHTILDLSAQTWVAFSTIGWRTGNNPTLAELPDNTTFWAEQYKSMSFANVQSTPYSIAIGNTTHPTYIYVNDGGSGNTPTGNLVAPLATPQTYQLDPVTVATLLGDNNIWADTGNLSVTYCVDTTMYIDEILNS